MFTKTLNPMHSKLNFLNERIKEYDSKKNSAKSSQQTSGTSGRLQSRVLKNLPESDQSEATVGLSRMLTRYGLQDQWIRWDPTWQCIVRYSAAWSGRALAKRHHGWGCATDLIDNSRESGIKDLERFFISLWNAVSDSWNEEPRRKTEITTMAEIRR